MAWDKVLGYRLRLNVAAGRGDALISTMDSSGISHTTTIPNLNADQFAAVATLLTSDKDHILLFDGTTLDAGPEKP